MTKTEAMRITRQENILCNLGFTPIEADQLRRISMTLRRWYELECGDGNGHIERDEKTGTTRYHNDRASYIDPHDARAWRVIPDRETGAKKRLSAIIKARNIRQPYMENPLMDFYIQTDPRGAALYILRPGDVPEGGDVHAYYSRGICVY
jgi:hypothetical protein